MRSCAHRVTPITWVYFPLSAACPHREHFWEGFWRELCIPAPGSYVDLCCYLFSMLTEHKELQFDCAAFQETQDTFLPLQKAILDGNFSPCGYHPSNLGLCSCWQIQSPDSVTSRHQDIPCWFSGRCLAGMSCLCVCSSQAASLLLGCTWGLGTGLVGTWIRVLFAQWATLTTVLIVLLKCQEER